MVCVQAGLSRGGSIAAVWLQVIAAACAAEISSFQAGDGGWHMGTLAVGNLDNDAQLEIVVPYRDSSGRWFLDALSRMEHGCPASLTRATRRSMSRPRSMIWMTTVARRSFSPAATASSRFGETAR